MAAYIDVPTRHSVNFTFSPIWSPPHIAIIIFHGFNLARSIQHQAGHRSSCKATKIKIDSNKARVKIDVDSLD